MKDVIPMMAIDSSSLVEWLFADIAILGIGKLLSPFELQPRNVLDVGH